MNKKNYIVAIIGRPNVGKSTLFNRLIGRRLAITTDIAGTTRDRLYEIVEWQANQFTLIDTAGLEFDLEERFKEDIQEQIQSAIDEADLIAFMVDAQTGLTDMDQLAINKLRKSGKKAVLIANKVDNRRFEENIAELYKLGIGEPISISALNGKGTGDLLDAIVENLEDITIHELKPEENRLTKIAILGRPNVGKSTLLNAFLGKNRALVSDVPGTTRDVIESIVQIGDEKVEVIDTAGIRRRGKVGKVEPKDRKEGKGKIEKYSALRSFRTAEEADIVLILIDAIEGVTAQDQHIAGFANEVGKGIILIVNKIDAEDSIKQNVAVPSLKRKFQFMPFAPVVFISAKTGKNLDKIGEIILEVKKARERKISTPELNNWLEKTTLDHPPAGLKNKKPKLKYVSQTDVNPPTFTIFSSYTEYVHFSYKRFLENELRKTFDFNGTSIRIIFKNKSVKKED